MRPVLRGRLHRGGTSFSVSSTTASSRSPGADAERPRKRNQHIHIGALRPPSQCGNGPLVDFGVVSKLLLGQPRGIPVAPENHGHDVFCDFSPFIFYSPFVAFVFLLFE